jgi:uncharacterized protein (TIGR03086 family)
MANGGPDRGATVDAVAALEEALGRTAAVVHGIRTPDLGRPTPCTGWTIRDLLNHVVAITIRFTRFAEGDDAPRRPPGDLLGNAPVKAYDEAAERSINAWRANPGALDRTCRLSFGRFDGRAAAAINAFDVMVHGWDLSRGLEAPYEIPDHLANIGLQAAELIVTPQAREDGQFGAPPPALESESPEERLLAMTGRNKGPLP